MPHLSYNTLYNNILEYVEHIHAIIAEHTCHTRDKILESHGQTRRDLTTAQEAGGVGF